MNHLRLIPIFLFFISCSTPEEELSKNFNNHLTNEQIGLIIEINKEYDEFLFKKFPEAENNLTQAYIYLSETIATQGAYDGYILPTEKLNSIKSKLIETGFYKELYLDSEEGYNHNYDGQYLNCLKKLGENDKDLKDFYEAIVESGARYNVSMGINAYTYLSNKNQLDSMKKLLLTFDLVLWQIELKTYANTM